MYVQVVTDCWYGQYFTNVKHVLKLLGNATQIVPIKPEDDVEKVTGHKPSDKDPSHDFKLFKCKSYQRGKPVEINLSFVQRALKAGAGINFNTIRWCIQRNNPEILQYLLENTDYQLTHHDYWWAARYNSLDCLKVMDSKVDEKHNLAIQEAARHGHYRIVEYLVGVGQTGNGEYNFALRWASNQSHDSIVELLKQHTDNKWVTRWNINSKTEVVQ